MFPYILPHLSVQGLKNARLVCRHWDEQVSPILRGKCAIKFGLQGQNPSLQFLRYAHEMQNPADWPNWKISLPNLPEDDQKNLVLKYTTDLTWFLQPSRGHHVKTLSLSGEISVPVISRYRFSIEKHLGRIVFRRQHPNLRQLWLREGISLADVRPTIFPRIEQVFSTIG